MEATMEYPGPLQIEIDAGWAKVPPSQDSRCGKDGGRMANVELANGIKRLGGGC
jgi:hypothetical protein